MFVRVGLPRIAVHCCLSRATTRKVKTSEISAVQMLLKLIENRSVGTVLAALRYLLIELLILGQASAQTLL